MGSRQGGEVSNKAGPTCTEKEPLAETVSPEPEP